jgi:hypothetical protein
VGCRQSAAGHEKAAARHAREHTPISGQSPMGYGQASSPPPMEERYAILAAALAPADIEDRNKAIVAASFDAWKAGTGSPYDLLADDAT